MNPQEFTLLSVAVLASGLGQFFLKLGATKLGKVTAENALSHVLAIATNVELVAGLFCYGIGAILYIMLLTRVNLSVAAPAASMIYIFSVLIGRFAFNEPLPVPRLVGIGLIVCGVILVAWQHSESVH
ncbi:MAG: EamA family transporter [Cyanobacteria bacterium P01_F01_bin.86]